ncbi:hypothetical protein NQ176_g7369 [Zarea fungicola]|uniref:Uncharacterized protein n=1 Tax=Zarea fungicola TaxID=93591 RepID=A0ACC1MZU9_9HYPO|nr:hypothetical protein NQ176_g7369 [Lecanicillium fungicola]
MSDTHEPFSKLEAGFAEIEIERRPISVHAEATNRFGNSLDHLVKDLDFNYNIPDELQTGSLPCLQGMLSALQYEAHVGNPNNFAKETEILCFNHMDKRTTITTLDSAGLDRILSSIPPEDVKDATSGDQSAAGHCSFDTVPNSTRAERTFPENEGCQTNHSTTAMNISPATDPTADTAAATEFPSSLLRNPFEIAVLLSSLSLEASKFHVGRFRRYMWQQFNKADDHLGGLEFSNRGHLTELTQSLQIISQQADSHLLNADVAILTAKGTYDVQTKLHTHLGTPLFFRQAAEDAIEYVISSMEKQKMLFLNYKSRKNGTMSLVYNLVTQSDAANNIQLSRSMKRDSTSMTAIAALTMVFLPGTFTSSVLSAGIFSARAESQGIAISNLWWLWVALTIPLTIVVIGIWWLYQRWQRSGRQRVAGAADEEVRASTRGGTRIGRY